ncbi:MAG: hypothetical protein BWY24_00661 [Microgenomates group bacterium ADurb.Bin219]|nr:MAG: hypothetical protein BWY24_00661 [Microgenomates group bacterium ADurb.Bin219]HNP89582.1 hypothetical protein [Candidatus Woesebacteria bacterium]
MKTVNYKLATKACRPLPIETNKITEAAPIIIPKVVKTERLLLVFKAIVANLKTSYHRLVKKISLFLRPIWY